ncbi:unnamed protein product [Protopolystoma xenopodis]|uniref:Uncharacterized protein n=1 Tax=Protopolystoma xenopodis TaxID=117903 RepID=A0A448WE17_9PLAT|nr:unnamed protein product [Protopolystoma xenopodis]
MRVIKISAPPIPSDIQKTVPIGSLLFGSWEVGKSANDVQLADLIIWFRKLEVFEKHRLIGYTGVQDRLLEKASYFWSTDPYIYRDASAQITFRESFSSSTNSSSNSLTGVSNYALASIYKPIGVNLFTDGLDYALVALVPELNMLQNNYFMLGKLLQ